MTTPSDQAQAALAQMANTEVTPAGDEDLLVTLRSVAELWEVIGCLHARGVVRDLDLALASARRQVAETQAAVRRTPGGEQEQAACDAQAQLDLLERQAAVEQARRTS